MIAIIDYGVGNLFSLQSSLKFIGADAEVTNDIAKIKAPPLWMEFHPHNPSAPRLPLLRRALLP